MYVNPNFPVYFPSPCLFPNYISSWTWRGVPLKTTSVFFSLSKRGPVGEFCVCVCVCVCSEPWWVYVWTCAAVCLCLCTSVGLCSSECFCHFLPRLAKEARVTCEDLLRLNSSPGNVKASWGLLRWLSGIKNLPAMQETQKTRV